ncbi:hypothetical protein [Georgenia subflava]|uniref:DUF2238 domain-containing protein n=1 Tax=Georgenia subflava TaxID=1622177 RepID=A0A6N7EMW3_9MICO|nr:hypothetical protein [Georgenia subflava]MPV37865.1 hypothetical protein [Georgenia subflava]
MSLLHQPSRTQGAHDARPRDGWREILAVPGPPWARVATDVVAGLGVASLAVATRVDVVAVAVMALVLLGLTVPRVAGVAVQLQAAAGGVLLGAAWASVFRGYEQVPWLDVVAHVLATGALAAVAVAVLLRAGMLLVPQGRRGRCGLVLVTASVGLPLSVLWELGEWFGSRYVEETINVGYDDTLADLAAGGVGAIVAGGALARLLRRTHDDPAPR